MSNSESNPGVWIVGSYEGEVLAAYQDELQARRYAMDTSQSVYFWEFADEEQQ